MNDIPDFVYFRAYNQIHIVEAKRFVADIYSAAFQLRRYRGNYKYFALPDGEYYNWVESVDELCDGTFGLILIRLKGSGLCAEFVYDSPRYNRDFSRYYDDYV